MWTIEEVGEWAESLDPCYENIITAAQGAILFGTLNVSSTPIVTILRLHEVGLL